MEEGSAGRSGGRNEVVEVERLGNLSQERTRIHLLARRKREEIEEVHSERLASSGTDPSIALYREEGNRWERIGRTAGK